MTDNKVLILIVVVVLMLSGAVFIVARNSTTVVRVDNTEKVVETISGPVLFSDNFDQGYKASWVAIKGNLNATGGKLPVGGEFYIDTLDSRQWRNYAVDVDILRAVSANLLLRAGDYGSCVVINFTGDGIRWWVYGGWARQFDDGSQHIQITLTREFHVRVEVKGPKYTIFVRQNNTNSTR